MKNVELSNRQTRVPPSFKKDLEKKLDIHGQKHAPYITVTQGMSGFFAVKLWFNPEMDGFWEPWDTGELRCKTEGEAEVEAKIWAKADGVEFRSMGK